MTDFRNNRPLVPDMGTFSAMVTRRLQAIYQSEFSEGIVNRILAIANTRFPEQPEWNEKDIILITYGNSILSPGEKPLKSLLRFLDSYLKDSIGCVHILPFFPFTSDDGFAVCDFMNVNPELGAWEDIEAIRTAYDLMADLVINHISSEHNWFRNFLQNKSPGKDYFIEPEGGFDYSLVIRPRSSPLFTEFLTANGMREVWTTFSRDQIDLNFANPEVLLEMIRLLVFYMGKGVRFIRLDAIAFIWKRKGTPCLHLNEAHEIVKLLRDIATYVSPGTVIITETNVPNKENWSYFGNADEANMVYQFSLPPLLLNAIFSRNSDYLTQWAKGIPLTQPGQTFLNYTASHDGIGVRPLEDILPEYEITRLIEGMVNFGGRISMKTNREGTLSPYEINITYFDAMKGTHAGIDTFQEVRFICSQTIMMSMKGIPAFYIHSILATPNDYEGVEFTGRARSINRKQLFLNDLSRDLSADTIRKRVYTELTRLIKIRRAQPAFNPGSVQEILEPGNAVFAFTRRNEATGEKIHCISNISDKPVTIESILSSNKKGYDLIGNSEYIAADRILLTPYQTIWLKETPI
jgi:sucrose phosphorylase